MTVVITMQIGKSKNGPDDVTSTSTRSGLNEYEVIRARNIERNNARFVALGLMSVREEQESNARAWKRLQEPQANSTDDNHDTGKEVKLKHEKIDLEVSKKPSRRKRSMQETSDSELTRTTGSRKSLRLQLSNTCSDKSSSTPLAECSHDDGELQAQREQRRIECHEARQRAAVEYANKMRAMTGLNNGGKCTDNPTATYEHCLHRVRTMSHKALENRIRIIERAAGKHCVIKMAITASCLKDEGLWDLADLASAALERLKGLQPPPSPK
jgi:hypothetical protein